MVMVEAIVVKGVRSGCSWGFTEFVDVLDEGYGGLEMG